MKPEEIKALSFLLDYYNAPEFEDSRDETTETWDSIASCMEEYADYKLQQSQREMLIHFAKWHFERMINPMSFEILVDEYIKSLNSDK